MWTQREYGVLFPTSVVGSMPGSDLIRELATGASPMSQQQGKALDAGIAYVVGLQEAAGLDIITDGEMRRYLFVQNFYGRMGGLQEQGPLRRTGFYAYDSVPRYTLTERISINQGLGIVEEFRYLQDNTTRPIKATCPGPLTMTILIRLTDSSIYKSRTELGLQFAQAINAELRELVEAGATYIQVDEPPAAIVEGELQAWRDLLNVALDGVAARRCLHVCFGNLLSRPRGKREYSTFTFNGYRRGASVRVCQPRTHRVVSAERSR